MPRTMGHFQVRRRQKAHRALCKKTPAHPSRRRQGKFTPSVTTPSRAVEPFYSLRHAIDACVEWHDTSPKRRLNYGFNNPSGLLPRQAFGQRATVSRGRDRAAPLPTHLLRICAGALKCPEQWGISKLESGQSPTSSRQGVLVCGALRLPHDLICLPLLFPQNSLRDFCGNPERQESAFSPLTQGRLECGFSNPSVRLVPRLTPPSYIGLPQRFCEAKDLWEEEQRASEQSRE